MSVLRATQESTSTEIKLVTDSNGYLKVDLAATSAWGAADDSAFTPGTSEVVAIGGMADETAPDSVDEGDVGAVRMSLNRNLYTAIRDAAGNERGVNVTASNEALVDVNSVTGAADLGVLADDAAFTPATSKVLMVGAEFDDTSPDSVDEGDGGAVRMSANRNLYSTIRDAAGNERGVNVTASNELNVIESNLSSAVQTDGSAISAKSVAIGGTDGTNQQIITCDTSGNLTLAGYTSGTTSHRVEEIDPISSHHTESKTTASSISAAGYVYLDMDGSRYFTFQAYGTITVDTLTLTVEGTAQDDGTAQASCNYVDITNDLFGVASLSIAATGSQIFMCVEPVALKYVRLKYTPVGGNNDADIAVYAKKMF